MATGKVDTIEEVSDRSQLIARESDEPTEGQVTDWPRGEDQGLAFRDIFFSLLFSAQVVIIVVLAVQYGYPAIIDNDDGDFSNFGYSGIMYLSLICGGVSFTLSSFSLTFMLGHSEWIIEFSLISSIASSFTIALYGTLIQVAYLAIIGIFLFIMELCYAIAVQPFIPFAASNLKVGLSALHSNKGIIVFAYVLVAMSCLWYIVWSLALVGTLDLSMKCDSSTATCQTNPSLIALLGLLISLFWTLQTLQNALTVTTAGVVGSWWVAPYEASSCCSKAVQDSIVRAMIYSFGSICLGSLLVAIVQTFQFIVKQIRESSYQRGGSGLLVCCADCILTCADALLRYFNKWAFIYVGIYGYTYFEAATNVMILFNTRGWNIIIQDDLVNNCLFLVSLVIGLLTGATGVVVNLINEDWFEVFDSNAPFITFSLGLLIGVLLSNIMMSVVSSAFHSVIVLFCEAPAEFRSNHPVLHSNLIHQYIQSGRIPGPTVILV